MLNTTKSLCMSLDDEKRRTLVRLYWNKATLTLDEFESAVRDSKWCMAANRMYYSLFHAVTALLVQDGHQAATHKGVKAALGLNYVKTGVLSTEEARVFAQLATLRERADYDVIFTASEQDILDLTPSAKALFNKIATMLSL